MTLKLVIFDCDGVLVDTEPTTERIMSANFATYGLDIPPHDIHTMFVGGTMIGAGQVAREMGADLPDDWVDLINDEVATELAKGVEVYAGLFDLLDALDTAGVHRAVASNGPMSKMKVSLTPSGLWDRFDGRIYSGREYGHKPAPDMLHHAMQVVGVTQEETVFIDDSVSGCRAGAAAGVRTYGFAPDSDGASLAAVGAIPMRAMTDIRAALF